MVGMVALVGSWRSQACVQSALQAVQRLALAVWLLVTAAECWWHWWLTHLLEVSGEAANMLPEHSTRCMLQGWVLLYASSKCLAFYHMHH
jgi:hypothetical protein